MALSARFVLPMGRSLAWGAGICCCPGLVDTCALGVKASRRCSHAEAHAALSERKGYRWTTRSQQANKSTSVQDNTSLNRTSLRCIPH